MYAIKGMIGGLALGVAFATAAVFPSSEALAATPACTTKEPWISPDGGADIYVPTTAGGNSACTMKQGANNAGVEALQLAIWSCYDIKVTVDGSFGSATKAALKTVQARLGITADGVYGPVTASKIDFASSVQLPYCGRK